MSETRQINKKNNPREADSELVSTDPQPVSPKTAQTGLFGAVWAFKVLKSHYVMQAAGFQ